ncbi:hypothetical protein B0J12DRAFT_611347 [Macrophomina phaseolina]|uniref:Zn(2)-C6 fungal-type domain-containing protein n=1 Tax=Macrophomina phaseolina TaxID=35725 RepID=A0ABQ8FQY7_9PEZI|nr:hypothetical protein B0J12DRAFT_611347 [Macrophomina phaseolina]
MRTKQTTVCHTCRAHKIGCDGNRPSCSQCLFIGRPCGGYQLDQAFVPYQPTVRKRGSGKVSPGAVQFNPGETQRGPSSDLKITHGSLIEARSRNAQRLPIPQPIDSPTFEEFTAVILGYFISPGWRSAYALPVGAIQTCGAWVEVLPRLAASATPRTLIFSAVKAFGTAILARGPHGTHIDYQSIKAYNTALRQLNNFLLAPKEFFHLETAASIACLAMVELMFATSTKGAYAHIAGFSALIKSYPPDLFSSGVLHAIFVGIRPVLLFQAFETRKSTFLAQEKWKRIPFHKHPASDVQALMSDAAVLPSLLEEADILRDSSPNTVFARAEIVKAGIMEVLERISNWKDRYQMKGTDPSCFVTQHPGVKHQQDSETFFLFPNLMIGNMHTHAWAFEIICLTEIEKIDMLLPDYGCTNELKTWPGRSENLRDRVFGLAARIYQSIRYFLQDEMKLFGPATAIFPLKTAYDALSVDPHRNHEHITRCRQLIACIHRKGLAIVPHFPAECVDVADYS